LENNLPFLALHFLLKGTCPIILVLARQMYKRIPELSGLPERQRRLIESITTVGLLRERHKKKRVRKKNINRINKIFKKLSAFK
jgi:hypothetical protein